MTRLRADYVLGVTDTALATGDTTLSGPALARLPVVASPNYAALTLSNASTGVYEIVYVTAHTASATTATITRAREGSAAAAWPSGASWVHGPTVRDVQRPGVTLRIADGVTQGTAAGARTVQNYGAVDAHAAFTVDQVAGTITTPYDGWYFLEGRIRNVAGVVGECDVMVNPGIVQSEIRVAASTAAIYSARCTGMAYLVAGTVARMDVYSDNTQALKSSADGQDRTYFRAVYMGDG